MADYSKLPEEIVHKIATKHLQTLSQLVAFSGVCTSWRSTALADLHNRRHVPFLPGILKSGASPIIQYFHGSYDRERRNPDSPHYQFQPISTLFHSATAVNPPPPRWSPPKFPAGRRMWLAENSKVDLEKCHCIASRDGWLVLANRLRPGLKIYLLNPVTRVSIPLPHLLPHRFEFGNLGLGHYTTLSSSPDDDDCHVIMVTWSWCTNKPIVAWCKVRGGGHWRFFTRTGTDSDSSFDTDSDSFHSIECATYFGDKLYVLDRDNYVHVFCNMINSTDQEGTSTTPGVMSYSYPFSSAMLTPYLRTDVVYPYSWTFYHSFELEGQLIVVLRHCNACNYDVAVQVYRLTSDYSWEEVKSLEGYAVFLGTHQSLCVAINNNDDTMVKGNHIYYIDFSCGHCDFEFEEGDGDFWYNHSVDYGVYSLRDQKLVEHYRGHDPLGSSTDEEKTIELSSRELFSNHIWFSPIPWDIHKHLNKQKKSSETAPLQPMP
ncbi:Putative F-box protein At2g33190 [Linum grandiflorum]